MIKRSLVILLASLALLPCVSRAKTITASGGTTSAVQTAIDAAASGDTVLIPGGTFSWSTGILIKKPIKVFGGGTGTTTINNTGNSTMVSMTPSTAGNVEFGKVKFTRGSSSTGLYVFAGDAPGKPMLVHDCAFETAKFGNRSIDWATNGGVIYNCSFVSLDKGDNSGVAFKNPSSDSAWHEVDYMGMKDTGGDKNTYIEDCSFKDIFLQAMDFDDNSRCVIRHCTFNDSAVASHGQETSAIGARAWELYDCDFNFTQGSNNNPGPQDYPLNMNHFVFVRGGGPGCLFNNKIPDISSSAWGNKSECKICLYNIRRRGQVPCQTLPPPAAHQIGWGINAAGDFVVDPLYIWGNTGAGNYNNPSIEDYNPDECGNNLHTSQFIRKGIEYYTGTPKPGYAPYTYPHPLRGGAGPTPTVSPSPSASPLPTATPVLPTPTPQPTATPQPSPPEPTPTPQPTPPSGATYRNWLDQLSDWIKNNPAQPDQGTKEQESPPRLQGD